MKLNIPFAVVAKLTLATPPAVPPKVEPTGLPDWADQVPVVGDVPVKVAFAPAQTVWSVPAFGLGVTVILAVSEQPFAVYIKL